MKLALLGCGAIARRAHLPAFAAISGTEVVAFASRTRASAEAARDQWASGDVFDHWQSALDADGIDAAVICTPNVHHCEMTLAAVERGLHVLVEKPMAPTVEEADRMIAAAEAAGVVLMPAQNVRFAPPFAAASRSVAAGDVGRVLSFRGAFGHGGPEGWAPEATWFFERDLAGGGALLDLGVHMVDVIHSVMGERVVEVGAMVDEDMSAPALERLAQVVMRTEGGAVGTLQASWSIRPGPDHQLTVFGTEGTLHLDSRTPLTLTRIDGTTERVELEEADNPFAAFARAVGGERPAVSAQDGRDAVAVVCAAYEAARTGTVVQVQPAARVVA